ncbi:MAG: hypothetical protein AAGI03_01880 [Pseudomonadota bacterium]
MMTASELPRPLQSADVSGMVVDEAMGKYVGQSKGLVVRFCHENRSVESVDPLQSGKIVQVLVVEKMPKGDTKTVSRQTISPEEAERLFPREYQAFIAEEELPAEGTALSELPGISRSTLDKVQLTGLHSIEELASMQPTDMAAYGLDVRVACELARKWIAARDGAVDMTSLAEQSAKTQIALEDVLRQNASLKESNELLMAKVEALTTAAGSIAGTQAQPTASQAVIAVADEDGFGDLQPETVVEGPAFGGDLDGPADGLPDPLAGDSDD